MCTIAKQFYGTNVIVMSMSNLCDKISGFAHILAGMEHVLSLTRLVFLLTKHGLFSRVLFRGAVKFCVKPFPRKTLAQMTI